VRTATETRELIAQTALAYIDTHGIPSLTLRTLGKEVGLHHTAVYRHFKDLNDVLAAVNALVITEAVERVGELPEDPRDRLLVLMRALRAAMHAHPAVTFGFLQPSPTIASAESVVDFQSMILESLISLGLSGRDLLLHHRLLETYCLGSMVFDFGGAPLHLESRRQRMRQVADPAYEEVTRDEAGIDALNEEAFDRGLVLLVDECARVGRESGAVLSRAT